MRWPGCFPEKKTVLFTEGFFGFLTFKVRQFHLLNPGLEFRLQFLQRRAVPHFLFLIKISRWLQHPGRFQNLLLITPCTSGCSRFTGVFLIATKRSFNYEKTNA